MTRIFLAHSVSESQPPETLKDMLRDHIQTRMPHVKVEVVTGKEDHEKNFKRSGSWNAWTADVVSRRDFTTYKRFYDIYVVPFTGEGVQHNVGKATYQILTRAKAANVPIYLWHTVSNKLIKVVDVSVTDQENYQAGFIVRGAA